MSLSNKELHTLNEIEQNLRADDPRLDRSLRTMMSPEDTTSMYLTLSILGVFVLGIALLVAGWVLTGLTVMIGGTLWSLRWASRRYYHPACHHLVPVEADRCPRCTAESSGTSGR